MYSRSFDPIAASDARVLILGSLPGQVSLQQRQYYALPRNQFWKIMGELFGHPPDLPYSERAARLIQRGISLWDVCHSAYRPGSLDSSIRHPISNSFLTFFDGHPQLKLICFNGAKAAQLYERDVLPLLPPAMQQLWRQTLPSTSPANAGVSYAEKLASWSIVREQCAM